MKFDQILYYQDKFHGEVKLKDKAQWVLIFGKKSLLGDNKIFDKIRNMYPKAYIMGCSSAGEIYEKVALNETIIINAIYLEKGNVEFKSFNLINYNDMNSYKIGENIISSLNQENLKHIFILSDGLNVNGSKLVEGMKSSINPYVSITGGLAGDGTDFKETYIIDNEYAKPNIIVIAALYGDIKIGCAAVGGWDTFGIERIVTKSKDNILYEMDDKPALTLYKEYLGEKSKELPSSALLFPLCVRRRNSNESYVRTVQAINESDDSVVLAGDIPEGSCCRLMKANYSNLINGAREAAIASKEMLKGKEPELAILISCFGRKMVLKQITDEEIEVVREIAGESTIITGFYSYGEIAPYKKDTLCEFHNQTMTITFISEG